MGRLFSTTAASSPSMPSPIFNATQCNATRSNLHRGGNWIFLGKRCWVRSNNLIFEGHCTSSIVSSKFTQMALGLGIRDECPGWYSNKGLHVGMLRCFLNVNTGSKNCTTTFAQQNILMYLCTRRVQCCTLQMGTVAFQQAHLSVR